MLDGPPQNSPNASRGSSLRLAEAVFKRQVDLAGLCPIPGRGCVARCLGSGLGRAGRGRDGENGGDFVLLHSNILTNCEELTQRRRDSLRNAEKGEGRRSSNRRSPPCPTGRARRVCSNGSASSPRRRVCSTRKPTRSS